MQNLKFESTKFPSNQGIVIRDKFLDLSTPRVMGIINLTPDSFYSGSRMNHESQILERVNFMLNSGATFIDLGGYSTRPGAQDVSIEEESVRVIPIIESIRSHFPDAIISLDTFRGEVAKRGIESGADLINDIGGFALDDKMLDVISHYKIPYILMHTKGTPQTMSAQTQYENLFIEVYSYFSEKLSILREKGVKDVIIDPGFGFAKNTTQNFELLKNLEHFKGLECPILVGISRKSMIYKKLGITPEESLHGTIALNAIGLEKGASILRVHDVKEAIDLVNLLK